MDRHICKAKRVDNGEWVYGYYIKSTYYLNEETTHIIIPLNSTLYPGCEISGYEIVNPDTICRCTGWIDSHKTPIFENDIVEFTCGTPKRDLVWWCNEMSMMTAIPLDGIEFNGFDYWNGKYPNYDYSSFCLMLQDPWGDFSEIKVIGNIIDNPKLMEN